MVEVGHFLLCYARKSPTQQKSQKREGRRWIILAAVAPFGSLPYGFPPKSTAQDLSVRKDVSQTTSHAVVFVISVSFLQQIIIEHLQAPLQMISEQQAKSLPWELTFYQGRQGNK